MRKFPVVLIAAGLLAATAAHAQYGGGGGGRGHGGRGQAPPDASGAAPAPQAPPRRPETPTDQVDIIGVVQAIGPEPDRVTIAYEPVEALNWPAGSMPFVVAKPDLLKSVTVGEKVRFRIDSQQISFLAPYVERPPSPFGAPGPR
jgi:Cu/Ag efflux protein CusF